MAESRGFSAGGGGNGGGGISEALCKHPATTYHFTVYTAITIN